MSWRTSIMNWYFWNVGSGDAHGKDKTYLIRFSTYLPRPIGTWSECLGTSKGQWHSEERRAKPPFDVVARSDNKKTKMGRSSVLIAVFAVTVAARADDDVDRTIAAKKIKNYWRPDGRTGKVLSRKRLRDNKERRLSSFLEDFLDFFGYFDWF